MGKFRGSDRRYSYFVQIISLNVIIDDQHTTLDSLNATENIKFKYPRIYYLDFMDFIKTSLTQSFFELEGCSFFQWVRMLPEIDWYHYQCCFPDKMSYDPTFLVKIDSLTDRTFCSPTVNCRFEVTRQTYKPRS